MALAQGGQAEAAVLARIGGVTHPDQGNLQQAHRRRQNLVLARAAQRKVPLNLLTQARQAKGEIGKPVELLCGGSCGPVGVIGILLTTAGVPSRRLDMTAWVGADPHLFPGRRNAQVADPVENSSLADHAPLRIAIAEAAAASAPDQARTIVGRPCQFVGTGRFDCLHQHRQGPRSVRG
ncbi:hypothetical protein D3C85_1186330 [compost metagenome]